MKVAWYYKNDDVSLRDAPFPTINDDEILLKVMASGICGSDLMEFHRIKKAPFVPGHEVAGEIVEIGKNISNYKIGDRIFATHHVPCNNCRECLTGHPTQCGDFKKINNFSPGGLSEYLKISGKSVKDGVIKIPNEMSYEEASFIEPLGTVVEVSEILRGDSVLILGSGVAGILNLQTSRYYRAGNIIATDISDYRLNKAEEFGVDHTINAKEFTPDVLRELNNGKLADRVIICTGAKSATEQAFQSYEQGGKIIFFATPPENEKVEIDWYQHWRNGLKIQMTYGASPRSNQEAFKLIEGGFVNVEDMITHRFSLEEIAKGFELASKGDECLKIIIKPHKNEP